MMYVCMYASMNACMYVGLCVCAVVSWVCTCVCAHACTYMFANNSVRSITTLLCKQQLIMFQHTDPLCWIGMFNTADYGSTHDKFCWCLLASFSQLLLFSWCPQASEVANRGNGSSARLGDSKQQALEIATLAVTLNTCKQTTSIDTTYQVTYHLYCALSFLLCLGWICSTWAANRRYSFLGYPPVQCAHSPEDHCAYLAGGFKPSENYLALS